MDTKDKKAKFVFEAELNKLLKNIGIPVILTFLWKILLILLIFKFLI